MTARGRKVARWLQGYPVIPGVGASAGVPQGLILTPALSEHRYKRIKWHKLGTLHLFLRLCPKVEMSEALVREGNGFGT